MKTSAPKRFLADVSATSAIEFALVLPLLATLALGSIELQRYQRISRQLLATADNIAEIVAQRDTAQTDFLNIDNGVTRHTFPEAARELGDSNWWLAVSHQISHVVFTPTVAGCVKNCTYTADLAWNWPDYDTGPGAGALRRKCGKLTAAANDAKATGETLPQALFGAGTAIVVDLRYAYKPMFGASLFSAVVMERQGFSFPRFAAPYIKESGPRTIKCAGYP